MAPTVLAISVLNGTLAALVVAGLFLRGRARACVFFPAYLGVGVAARLAVWTWPELYTWNYWLATELLQSALGFGVAVEFARRAFSALPAGRARALRVQLLLAAAAGLLLLLIPLAPADTHTRHWQELLARLAHARAWVFAGGLAVAYYHGVPLDRIHREIAAGFVVWSLIMAGNAQLGQLDGLLQVTRQTIASLVYPGVLMAWLWAAWAPEEETTLSPRAIASLRPWRA